MLTHYWIIVNWSSSKEITIPNWTLSIAFCFCYYCLVFKYFAYHFDFTVECFQPKKNKLLALEANKTIALEDDLNHSKRRTSKFSAN